MTSVAARSADDTPDDVPARVSTFDLRLPTQKLLWEAMAKPSNNSVVGYENQQNNSQTFSFRLYTVQ